MDIRNYMQDHLITLDGGLGTLLQAAGLQPGERTEQWNLTHPGIIRDIHADYYRAGSNIVSANTFGINGLLYSEEETDRLVQAAMQNVREAQKTAGTDHPTWAALDIGSCGRMLKPFGDLEFEDAVSAFAMVVRAGVRHGADLIFIETMNDSYETKAALLAAKENSDLPVFVSNAYSENGRLMTGATPVAMVAMLEGMGADAIGVNCSMGPAELMPVVKEYLKYASVPVLVKPNAGLPKIANGKTVFNVSAEEFSDIMTEAVKSGARLAGGCCGTTPEYIAALHTKIADISPVPLTRKEMTVISSYAGAADFSDGPLLIGERINPTGKKRLKQALLEHDMAYILQQGVEQEEKGAQILDVNTGMPEIDETVMLPETVAELQAVTSLPLQIDTASPEAMEKAMRIYNGKPLVNSVNGKRESMEAIFPLVRKYGGTVIALTLDENGIPEDADGRVRIAGKILKTAAEWGIEKKDIVFDALTMTVSAAPNAAEVTLEAVRRIRTELGCHTSLGVSNVSFGLPARPEINSVFFTAAMENGLSAAIMNPLAEGMMRVWYGWKALHGKDTNFENWIRFAGNMQGTAALLPADAGETDLKQAVIKGLKSKAAELTVQTLQVKEPMDIIREDIIPALNTVGEGFEKQTVYLPQLLMSAETASAAFEKVKEAVQQGRTAEKGKGPVILATVKGDIHDIGKNIVRLLLENYGFEVVDLGRDVAPETILQAAREHHAPLVGLSALMTTTVPAMAETVALLNAQLPGTRTVVGGAVLTAEYAAMIHADHYAPDAMDTVRYAEKLIL